MPVFPPALVRDRARLVPKAVEISFHPLKYCLNTVMSLMLCYQLDGDMPRLDLRKTKELSEKLKGADETFQMCRSGIGFEEEAWVSNEHYEMAVALAELLKSRVLATMQDKELRDKLEANWFLDDMDEEDYM